MEIINLSNTNSVLNSFLAEIRDNEYQKNRALFRNNIERIGEMMAYEMSKTLDYECKEVVTPLDTTRVFLPKDDVVIATVFRAGLPLQNGFIRVFDHADCAFVSAYREYTDAEHTMVGIRVEYLASPSIDGKILIVTDPMLATGGSLELSLKAFMANGKPKHIHLACVIAAPEGIEHIKRTFPENTTVWCAAIDERLNEHKYILPGLGDAGDLCFGEKL